MFDSVFSEFVSHEEVEIKYPEDKPILGFEDLAETVGKAEEKWTSLLLASSWTAVDRLLDRLKKPMESMDSKAIDKELQNFNITGAIQTLLFGAWSEMFKTGQEDGQIEVNEIAIANRRNREKILFGSGSSIAEFAKKRKPAFEIAYPPDHENAELIEIEELREALNLRTQVLAEE